MTTILRVLLFRSKYQASSGEHPVTEAITGLDLVLRIESAEGKKLNLVVVNGDGYAIEFRLYAEDPNNNQPVTGKINAFQYQPMDGLRVESAS